MQFSLLVKRLMAIIQRVPLPFWLALMIILPVGIGAKAVWLLSQRDVSECEAAQTDPDVTDSTRLYCAQQVADRNTTADLVEAIRLANAISYEHPLRTNGDRLIERWSRRLMEMAESTYQNGNLQDAIALTEQIPIGTPVYESISPKVQEWRATWTESERIYESAQTALTDDKPTVALAEARKLLRMRNQYWSTTRFQELATQIQAQRENRKKTTADKPQREKNSFSTKPVSTNDLLSDWEKEQEAEAIMRITKAKQLAAGGTIANLRDAISSAQLVFSGTSRYPQARRLIDDWTHQIEIIEDRPVLDRAAKLASKGDMSSLQAAISEANNIYFGRALYQEAQSRIDEWTVQVRQLHDQEYSRQNQPSPANQFR